MKKKTKDKSKKKYSEKQIERMKADSIRLAILYRSLYILKYKFEKYKNEVNKVYDNGSEIKVEPIQKEKIKKKYNNKSKIFNEITKNENINNNLEE